MDATRGVGHPAMRVSGRRLSGACALGACLLSIVACVETGGAGDHPTGVDDPGANPPTEVSFAEVPGEREFSGRLVARPREPGALVAAGRTPDEARAIEGVARARVVTYRVNAHVAETGEYVFEVPPGTSETEVARELLATGAYDYVEPDWIVYPVACPDDGLFAGQWHHRADRMQSCDGWDLHTGDPSVSIGVCDTGVLTTHPDLLRNRLEGYNAVDRLWESAGGAIGPVHPHGTQVTGCAAANGNNDGVGVTGVGWNLSHRMLRVSNSERGSAALSNVLHAARTAIESGDRVASVSYTGADSESALATAAYIKSRGGLLVWAAGNDGRYLMHGDRDDDDLIVVGATDREDARASFSAFGPFVDVTAPGVSILTTLDTGGYSAPSGTSVACPLVAGLCALIWSANPGLSPDQVESILKTSADDLGEGGVDDVYGYGRINVYEAMLIAAVTPEPPAADFTASVTAGEAPLTVEFTDLSTGTPTSWSWEFGDGEASIEQHPSHTYRVPGSYTVSLTASGANGATTKTEVDYITVEPGAGGVTGEGFVLSQNADFATDDRAFAREDTLYMRIWSDRVGAADVRKARWELKGSRRKRIKGDLTSAGDGSFVASFDLAELPSDGTRWRCKLEIGEGRRTKFKASASIKVGAGLGEGFRLSRNADFSTEDRAFSRTDTIFMQVWSDEVDNTRLRKTEWVLEDSDGRNVKSELANCGDGSFTASFDLANLPSNATSWRWRAKLEEGRRDKFKPATMITVD